MTEILTHDLRRVADVGGYPYIPTMLMRKAADEIDRLNKWADEFSDAQLKERAAGEALLSEFRAEIDRLTPSVAGNG